VLTVLRKNPIKAALLVNALPWVAGAVNATGFLEVGVYTSHVTGNVARAGVELAENKLDIATGAFGAVACFFTGVLFAASVMELARRHARARYSIPLLVEALVLSGLMGSTELGHSQQAPFAWTGMLAFAMGLQNALVTRLSGAVVRTTHLTGVTTDMGIELVRVLLWGRDELRAQRGGVAQLRQLFHLFRHRELDRLWLHTRIFTSFLIGAVVGPFLYLHVGAHAMALPVLILIGLAAFDAFLGLDPWHGSDSHKEALLHQAEPTASGTPAPPPQTGPHPS